MVRLVFWEDCLLWRTNGRGGAEEASFQVKDAGTLSRGMGTVVWI